MDGARIMSVVFARGCCVCLIDRGFVCAKGGVFYVPFFSEKERNQRKLPKRDQGWLVSSRTSLTKRRKPLPLWIPPHPFLGNRSLCKQRGSYYAFPSRLSTAFICRYTHGEGCCPNNVGYLFAVTVPQREGGAARGWPEKARRLRDVGLGSRGRGGFSSPSLCRKRSFRLLKVLEGSKGNFFQEVPLKPVLSFILPQGIFRSSHRADNFLR